MTLARALLIGLIAATATTAALGCASNPPGDLERQPGASLPRWVFDAPANERRLIADYSNEPTLTTPAATPSVVEPGDVPPAGEEEPLPAPPRDGAGHDEPSGVPGTGGGGSSNRTRGPEGRGAASVRMFLTAVGDAPLGPRAREKAAARAEDALRIRVDGLVREALLRYVDAMEVGADVRRDLQAAVWNGDLRGLWAHAQIEFVGSPAEDRPVERDGPGLQIVQARVALEDVVAGALAHVTPWFRPHELPSPRAMAIALDARVDPGIR